MPSILLGCTPVADEDELIVSQYLIINLWFNVQLSILLFTHEKYEVIFSYLIIHVQIWLCFISESHRWMFVICLNILKSMDTYIWMYHFYHSFDLDNKLFGCTLSWKTSCVTLYMSYLIMYFLMFLSRWHVLTLILTWISNYNHYKLWDEIT